MVQTSVPCWGLVSAQEPVGLGSAPDFATKFCVTVRKLLCLLEPQLPHLLIRDDGNADGDLDLTRTK